MMPWRHASGRSGWWPRRCVVVEEVVVITVLIRCRGGRLDGMTAWIRIRRDKIRELYFLSRVGKRLVIAGIDPAVMNAVHRQAREGGMGWSVYRLSTDPPEDDGALCYVHVPTRLDS